MKSFQPTGQPAPIDDFAPLVAAPEQAIGRDLKYMFDSLTAGPMPDRLVQLADALEEAFQRGDLFEPQGRA